MFFKSIKSKLIFTLFFVAMATSVFSAEKNITYLEILENPNDLDLNLKYAQQQGDLGNFKQTISTLERLNIIYPDNVEIKLYLLSVLVQIDSPEKAKTIIEEMKQRRDLDPEDLETLKEIEAELDEREPSLWTLALDVGLSNLWTNNVNSVSRTRLKMTSDEREEFGTAKHDRTGTVSMGLQHRDLLENSHLYLSV